MDKNGKRLALVTGGNGGLGTAMCKKLFEDGYGVIANYFRNHEEAQTWQAQLKAEGYDIAIAEGDVSSFEACEKMVKDIEQSIGSIDILVNNAGITRDTFFHKMTAEQWLAVISTNLNSLFNTTRQVIEGMRERKYGRIINISSINGQQGQMGQTNYSAAKAGVHGFTKSLAMEVAHLGITVNTISPGYIGTDMVMAIREDVRDKIVAKVPVGRLGGTDEIAYLVSFLASDKASFITGANHSINGGQHMY